MLITMDAGGKPGGIVSWLKWKGFEPEAEHLAAAFFDRHLDCSGSISIHHY